MGSFRQDFVHLQIFLLQI